MVSLDLLLAATETPLKMASNDGDERPDVTAVSVETYGSDELDKGVRRPHLRVLPPAANWYCSQVCDWGYDTRNMRWLVVYGAKNGLCIYEFNLADSSPVDAPKKNQQLTLDQTLRGSLRMNFVALLPRGKKDGRVTALRCLRDADGELRVVCAGEEGAIQIWDPVALRRVDQHRKHNNTEISAVSIRSDLDPNWIVAGDRQGVVSVWQRDTASVEIFTPVLRDAVFAMDIAPHDKTLVAVGYRSGALCVVDVVEKTVRYRLDGHDLEVQAVVWAPLSATTQYLATASRDRSIKVWALNTSSEGDETRELVLAARLEVRKPQQASSHSQSTRLWLPLAWTSTSGVEHGKYGLWSGSFEGNLQLWQWNGAPRGTIKPSLVAKNGHNRLLFGVVPMVSSQARPPSATRDTVATTESSSPPPPSLFVTISLDRDLRIWSEPELATKTPAAPVCMERIPAQGGFAYSLDFNHARKLLACGIGDQTIRLWNLSAKQAGGGYHSELVWKGLQSKITSVRWHPIHDHVLAFGTEDGRVGLWDLKTKTSQRLKMSRSGAVRHLEWTIHSPSAAAQAGEDGHVVGGGGDDAFTKAIQALEKAQAQGQTLEEALERQEKDSTSHTSSAKSTSREPKVALWSVDQAGTLCCTDADKLTTVDVRKDCASFTWDATFVFLAVGLSNGKVEIWRPSPDARSGLVLVKSIHEHKDSVTAVAWSITTTTAASASLTATTLLASSSKSGEILVYESADSTLPAPPVRRFKPVAGYGEHVVAVLRGHTGMVNCLRWNETTDDEQNDLLTSCGDDGKVYVWDLASQSVRALFTLHAGRVFAAQWITPTVLSSSGQDQSIRIWDFRDHFPTAEQQLQSTEPATATRSPHAGSGERALQKKKAVTKSSVVNSSVESDASELQATKPAETTKPKTKKKAGKLDAIFGTSDSNWMLFPGGGGGDDVSSVFCANGLVDERKRLEQEEKWEQAAHVLLLEGRVGDALRLVASRGMLSDAWVAYAPMAGQVVWREVSLLFARQLQSEGEYKRAALQFLAVSKIESAVQCFVAGGLYPEALSLIHLRLGPHHALLHTTLWEYADKLAKKKQTQDAIHAYLTIGSDEARVRAVAILASTETLHDAKRAMQIWTNQRASQSDHAVSLPTSVFMSVVSIAWCHRDFLLVEQTLANVLTSTSSSSPQRVLYKLSQCVAGIAGVLDNQPHDVPPTESNDKLARLAESLSGCERESSSRGTAHEASLLLEALQESSQAAPWASIAAPQEQISSTDVWTSVLEACRRNGLWFNESELTPDDAVEQLGDKKVFAFILPTSGHCSEAHELLTCSYHVLKFVAELLSGYLLSALEALRDLLSSLVSSPNSQLARLQRLFPAGVIDASAPPAFGELHDEADDTRVLWTECFLLQCDLIVRHAVVYSLGDSSTLTHVMMLLDNATESPAFSASLVPFADRLRLQIESMQDRSAELPPIDSTAATPSVEQEIGNTSSKTN